MRHSLLPVLLFATACTSGEAARSLGHVVVDSVGGIPRTITVASTGWTDTTGWKVVEVARLLGGVEGPGELIEPLWVTVDATGRIYVLDNSPTTIKLYSPTGEFLRTIGRQGSGPGEYQSGMLIVAGPHLFVQDPAASRASVFDTAGRFLRSWPSSCCYWTGVNVDAAGNFGIQGRPERTVGEGERNPYWRLIRWHRADSTMADSTLIPSGPEAKYWPLNRTSGQTRSQMMVGIPFMPSLEYASLPDRRLVYGYADRYLIAVTARNGADTLALFGRQWSATPIPDATRSAELESRIARLVPQFDERTLRNSFQLGDIPTTAPAYDWFGVDGTQNIWVRLPLPGDSTRTLFDVFDPQLRWLGQVSGPRILGEWNIQLSGDRMVGWGEDEEGNPLVVVYRIER